jgi:hypothetical protein
LTADAIEFTAQPVIPTNGTFLEGNYKSKINFHKQKLREELESSLLMHEINVLTN